MGLVPDLLQEGDGHDEVLPARAKRKLYRRKQLPGMIDTLRAHFGVGSNLPGLGLAAAQDYLQGAAETSSAFADRIFLAYSKDLGTETAKWHWDMKLILPTSFSLD